MNFGLLDQGKLNKINKCLKVIFFSPNVLPSTKMGPFQKKITSPKEGP